MAVFAPIPSAIEATATSMKPGCLAQERAASRTSETSPRILSIDAARGGVVCMRRGRKGDCPSVVASRGVRHGAAEQLDVQAASAEQHLVEGGLDAIERQGTIAAGLQLVLGGAPHQLLDEG